MAPGSATVGLKDIDQQQITAAVFRDGTSLLYRLHLDDAILRVYRDDRGAVPFHIQRALEKAVAANRGNEYLLRFEPLPPYVPSIAEWVGETGLRALGHR